MKITLQKIWDKNPCGTIENSSIGWGLLTKNLGTRDLKTEVSLTQILESNGIKDAIWALRCIKYEDYCLFNADVVENVLNIFEKIHKNDGKPRLVIKAIGDFKAGNISLNDLKKAVASAAAYADAYADAYTNAAADAAAYTDAADDAADVYAYAYADAAAADTYAYADAATYAVAYATKWQEIEQIFVKHFGIN